MPEPIQQQSRLDFAARNALDRFADRAALLLDASGTIRAATPAAAALFQRKLSELTGLPFGIVPLAQPEVQVDLVNPGGRRRTVVARTVASDSSRDWTIVLLAEQSPLLFEQTARAALADVGPLLDAHRLSLEVSPWPFIESHPATRELLATAIRQLVQKAAPRGGTLIVYSHVASGAWITVGLVLFGSTEVPVSGAVSSGFDALVEQVRRVEGFLQLDLENDGWALQLILPAGRRED